MLRYLERLGLVVPSRTASGYRLYGLRQLNQLRSLAELRRRFGLELGDVAFALRLRREPALHAALDTLARRQRRRRGLARLGGVGTAQARAAPQGRLTSTERRTEWRRRSATT